MKQLLLVALVLFVTTVKGQEKSSKAKLRIFDGPATGTGTVSFANLLYKINQDGDTLHILDLNSIKFIKIGDRVYKIESPTLTEVPKPLNLSGSWLNDKMILTPNNTYFNKN